MPAPTSCRNTTSPFHSLTRIVWQASAGSFAGERGQLVVMRREQGAAAIDLVQMLERRPGDRQPVIGRGAAADLVEDDKGVGAGLVEDRRGLDHLDHEGRAAARQIVGGADPAEQAVDDADPGRARRHEGAHLRQDRDQRVLAQKGALAGHVGAGDEPDPVIAQDAVIGDEAAAVACRGERRLDHRVAAARYLEGGSGRRPPAAPSRPRPRARQCRREVERGQRRRGRGDLGAPGHDLADEIVVQAQFQGQCPLGGAGDLALQLGQFGRRIALRPRHRLAMDEFRPELAGMVRPTPRCNSR